MENHLCDILRNINANFGRRIGVSFPIFDGSENEDVFEFLDKFKRAATLNGRNDDDKTILMKVGKCDELLEKNSNKL